MLTAQVSQSVVVLSLLFIWKLQKQHFIEPKVGSEYKLTVVSTPTLHHIQIFQLIYHVATLSFSSRRLSCLPTRFWMIIPTLIGRGLMCLAYPCRLSMKARWSSSMVLISVFTSLKPSFLREICCNIFSVRHS